jgi:hypothetical protein
VWGGLLCHWRGAAASGFSASLFAELVGWVLLLPGSVLFLGFVDLMAKFFPNVYFSTRSLLVVIPSLNVAAVLVAAAFLQGLHAVLRLVRREPGHRGDTGAL